MRRQLIGTEHTSATDSTRKVDRCSQKWSMDVSIHITTPHLKVLIQSEDNHFQQLKLLTSVTNASAHVEQSQQLGNGDITLGNQSPAVGVSVNICGSTDTVSIH